MSNDVRDHNLLARVATLESLFSHLTAKVNRAEANAAHAATAPQVQMSNDCAIAAIDAAISVIDRVNVELGATTVVEREEARSFLQRIRYHLRGR